MPYNACFVNPFLSIPRCFFTCRKTIIASVRPSCYTVTDRKINFHEKEMPMNHTIAKRVSLLLVVLLLAVSLIACQKDKDTEETSNEPDPAVGTYTGVYGKWVGSEEPTSAEDDPFSMDLNADGTGMFHRDGMDFDLTWTLDGTAITIKETFVGLENNYAGTLENGKLHIFNGDPEDELTYEYMFEKK